LTDYHSSYSDEAEERYKGIAQTITKEDSKLVSETKELIEKTRQSEKQIHSQLEDFLKSNNLRLETEPSVQLH
jgi:transcription elongation factor GreA-like protein